MSTDQRPVVHHSSGQVSILGLLAGRSGSLLVPGALSTQSGIPRATLARYLELLSAVFLIKQVPAWITGATGRALTFGSELGTAVVATRSSASPTRTGSNCHPRRQASRMPRHP
jgi:hypothetical protein